MSISQYVYNKGSYFPISFFLIYFTHFIALYFYFIHTSYRARFNCEHATALHPKILPRSKIPVVLYSWRRPRRPKRRAKAYYEVLCGVGFLTIAFTVFWKKNQGNFYRDYISLYLVLAHQKKSRMIIKFDPYGTFMINRGNRILILFHLHCCSRHKLFAIPMTNTHLRRKHESEA